MWGYPLSGWERERIGSAYTDISQVTGQLVDAVYIPDWLTDPVSRAKWLTLSDKDKSDWARAHASATAGSAAAAAAESRGKVAEEVQALEEAYASKVGELTTNPPPARVADHRWVLWAGGAALVGYLVLRRGGRKKVSRK